MNKKSGLCNNDYQRNKNLANTAEDASFMRLKALDSLRGLASLGIAFFWHYKLFNFQLLGVHPELQPGFKVFEWFYLCGWNLVDFFFILSGFVFMHVYSEKIARNGVREKDFFILRLSRLYPLHIIALLIAAFVQYFRLLNGMEFHATGNNDLYHLILNVLFMQSGFFQSGESFNGPSWTLSCEMIAYILFFYILTKSRKPILMFIICILTGFTILQMRLEIPLFNPQTAKMLTGFFIGCVTFKISNLIAGLPGRARFKLFTAIFLFLGIIIFLSPRIGYNKFFGQWDRVMPILFYPLAIILTLNLKYLNIILSIKPFTYLGDLSYSIYLLHFPVMLMLVTFLPMAGIVPDYTKWSALLTFMITTILLSVISHHFAEKPLQKYLRRKYL